MDSAEVHVTSYLLSWTIHGRSSFEEHARDHLNRSRYPMLAEADGSNGLVLAASENK